ncbi:two-component system OmpR family response regulator [Brevundimonas vesicularis]|uniref:response regulator n=1 Tax=Brevundimonas vesicularis TaxID=41276 RepID=UPI0018EB140B|nr:response regulator [Brevundimonas vesicularis]MDQ1193852.1 two-component system OmpR family response regulator [Brevundimonas vesicularis]
MDSQGPARAADILIVDDDPSVRGALLDYLAGPEFSVRGVEGAVEMDGAIAARTPDLIILDVMMPGETGLSICRRLGDVAPVLMLSAAGETTDRIVGLELGAADYLSKPFEPRELLARIRAILRRPSSKSEAVLPGQLWLFAGWRFDSDARSLLDPSGRPVILTTGELSLLLAFVEHPGRLLSRDRLLTLTHGPLTDNFDRAVDLAVSRLRRKLERSGQPPLIETQRGLGYRFAAEVRRR